jgi:hypothetical protein
MRSSIFISYSHHDEEWHERFKTTLDIAAHRATFEIWSDTRIEEGTQWREQIENAIAASRIALLLVSNGFVESKFIRERELIPLLKRTQIFWVPIEKLSDMRLTNIGLEPVQAAWKTDRPLKNMSYDESRDAIDSICNRMIQALGLSADTGPDAGDRLMRTVKNLLYPDFKIEGPIAEGDFSIIFDATRGSDRFAVKSIISSRRREWLGKDFMERAALVEHVTHPSLIRIVARFPSDPASPEVCDCVVSDYVAAKTLEAVLKESNGRLSADRVANLLHQLAEGCAELHQAAEASGKVLLMGPLRPSNVFYDAKEKVQISLARISFETMQTCHYRPTLLLEDTALTYLTPERYAGRKPGAASDQYHLALLGLELLAGKPPVMAENFSDLKEKEKFFERPHDFFEGGLRTRDPALSFVLAKMLQREPEKRWPSMHDASVALDRVAQHKLPDELRSTGKKFYQEHLHNNTEFYRSFYETFFKYSERARELFNSVELDTQYKKFDEAMDLLLTFRAEDDPTTLSKHSHDHAKHNLRSSDFDAFQRAFLDTLAGLFAEEDAFATDAWRAILAAGVSYMANRAGDKGA